MVIIVRENSLTQFYSVLSTNKTGAQFCQYGPVLSNDKTENQFSFVKKGKLRMFFDKTAKNYSFSFVTRENCHGLNKRKGKLN